MTPTDDPIYLALARALANEGTSADVAIVTQWRSESFEHEREFERLQQISADAGRLPAGIPWNAAEQWSALQVRLDGAEKSGDSLVTSAQRSTLWLPSTVGQSQRFGTRLFRYALGVAASGAIALVALVDGHHLLAPASQESHYATGVGKHTTVTLHDGTQVTLAPQTTLRVSSTFGAETRTVTLTGEAFFNVTTATGAPFIVRAGSISTRVLGTSFSVRRYPTDTAVQIAVMSGKVAAQGRRTPISVIAGRLASVTDSTATVETLRTLHSSIDWRTGRLIFDEETVSTMLATVGRWYGYQFRVTDSTLANQRVTMTFNVSDAKEMMTLLRTVLEVGLHVDGRVITIAPRETAERKPGPAPVRTPAQKDVFKPSMEIGR